MNHKDTYSPMFTAALFVIARKWKQPRRYSTKDRIKNMGYTSEMEYYTEDKKERKRERRRRTKGEKGRKK